MMVIRKIKLVRKRYANLENLESVEMTEKGMKEVCH